MLVKRIVANIACEQADAADAFYGDIFGLQLVMDHGWFRTFASESRAAAQVGIATEGGNGTPVPNLSIEVDDLDEALDRCRSAQIPIEYGPAVEDWGVRRFFVRDPFGKLVNVLEHA
ncbi:Glyoxalase-like domain protein [Maioricimonas rarisocia]|uniref:Glyoxalase-like domain protein n=1 Tax=Maioricimonas rarisocia TaxID=2528026 RepID=A0A517Z9G9_9PLAN|nr:VOC family protein [Maioricimonas rarisocia]QDU39099.1 Glyoxalase-like domain protein [Maioricimonas rarisocia]